MRMVLALCVWSLVGCATDGTAPQPANHESVACDSSWGLAPGATCDPQCQAPISNSADVRWCWAVVGWGNDGDMPQVEEVSGTEAPSGFFGHCDTPPAGSLFLDDGTATPNVVFTKCAQQPPFQCPDPLNAECLGPKPQP